MIEAKSPWTSKNVKGLKENKMRNENAEGSQRRRNNLTLQKGLKDGAEPSCRKSTKEILIQTGA